MRFILSLIVAAAIIVSACGGPVRESSSSVPDIPPSYVIADGEAFVECMYYMKNRYNWGYFTVKKEWQAFIQATFCVEQ